MATPHLTGRAMRAIASGAALGLSVTALSIVTAPSAQAATVSFTLLDINDYHGRISNDGGTGSGDATTFSTVELATTIQGIRSAEGAANVLLLSAGDNIGASLFNSSYTNDQPTVDVLNELDLATSALGNHEFDKGYDWLKANVVDGTASYRKADFPLLGANVYVKGSNSTAQPAGIKAYSVHQVAGVDVCVIGAITQETGTLVSPAGIANLDFGDPVDAVNRVSAELETAGTCDVTVATYHEGAGAGTPDGATLQQEIDAGGAFAKIVTATDAAVDVIFTGHTHKEYVWSADKPGGGTRPVVQTGSYGQKLGQIDLTYDDATDAVTVDASSLVAVGTTENLADPVVSRVDSITNAAVAAANVVGDVAKGKVSTDITTAYSGGTYTNGTYTGGSRDDRLSESTLGNLAADALKDTAIKDIPGLPTPVIGVVNPGGLRNELFFAPNQGGNSSPQDANGVVTFEEANAVLPFANNISYVTLTGAEFKQVLEEQWQTSSDGVSRPSRPFLHLGLSKNVRVVAKPDTSATSPVGGNILSVSVDGQPLDPAKEYVVSTFSFLAAGGDNFRSFKEGTNRDTGKVDRDLWIDGYFGNGQTKSPSFARRQSFATGLPTGAVASGSAVNVDLSRLNLTSLGSPANTSVKAFLVSGTQYRAVGSFPVDATGAASVDFTAPSDLVGDWRVSMVAEPSRTQIGAELPKLASTTTATIPAKVRFGTAYTVPVTVAAPIGATGLVRLMKGTDVVSKADLKDGKATLEVGGRQLKAGKSHALTVQYVGDDLVGTSSTPVAQTKVKKAKATKLKVVVKPKRLVAKRTWPSVKVTITPPAGFKEVLGQVAITAGGRTVKAKLDGSKTSVRIRPFMKAGKKTIKVTYLGSDGVQRKSVTIKVKVVRRR